ncbi:hypothetical protein IU451_28955 [Nocardia cyriacigeorgica]|uniref:hypothetical protein n=1 Tax=Nocardia cyriacigeorgica TaxID=135487 RepID=UPI0018943C09|nr:hypothetical protein [Nocardia cyriacigeorgica]MBF6326533.1 hypothetical protein [Nocardia cyriacigeorgica]
MLTTDTEANVHIAAEPGTDFATLTVENHAGRLAVTLSREELRTVLLAGVAAWGDLDQ